MKPNPQETSTGNPLSWRKPSGSNKTAALIVILFFTTLFSGAEVALAQAGSKDLTYAGDWGVDKSKPALGAFRSWVNRYVLAPEGAVREQMLSEGIDLAKQRRRAFAELVRTDPAQALASTVPAAVRQRLPAQISGELEVRVSGIGDYCVLCALAATGGPPVEPVQRFVRLNGRTYRAHVYGRRLGETTKYGIPLHGVALDGALALHESALRELEPGETPSANHALLDLRPAAQGRAQDVQHLAEVGDEVCTFASAEQLQEADKRLASAETGIGPSPKSPLDAVLKSLSTDAGGGPKPRGSQPPDGPQPNNTWTEGEQSVLVIRVDFSDLPGDPDEGVYTAPYVKNLADTQISPYYQQSSYGITALTNTVTPQLYRLPQSAANYATNLGSWQLHFDAAAAAAADYNVGAYDRVVVLFSWLGSFPGSTITYGGMAEVGGTNVWVNGEFDFRVVAHELGHTYGLLHGNLWQVDDGDPISDSGSSTEYGDDFDTMGANYANDLRTDFNPWFKNELSWIPDSQIITVTSNGTYRVSRFDNATGAGVLALKIVKDSDRNYWIGCRRSFTDNPSMEHGAYVIWGHNSNQHSELLDMTTPGFSDQDAALAVGSTLIDPAANVSFQPVAEGGIAPDEYIDIQVTFGAIAPIVNTQPKDQTVTPGQSAVLMVLANGNPVPSYQWQRQAAGAGAWTDLTDGVGYSGSSTATLIVVGTTLSMGGDQFRCVISNSSGITNSRPAILSVIPFGVTTIAGQIGLPGHADGTGSVAQFSGPSGVAVDGAGNVFVADPDNSTIRKITPAGGVSTFAGLAGARGNTDGAASNARFAYPYAVAVDTSSNVYVGDIDMNTIRKITPAGVVTTLAGLAGSSGSADGTGSAARFNQPFGVAVDLAGNVYVADGWNYTIRKVSPAGAVSTLAGLAGSYGSADGNGSEARFSNLRGVAVDRAGNVYVADSGNYTVRKITPAGAVSTLAGLAGAGGSTDGTGSNARFDFLTGVGVDFAGNVYVADTDACTLRKITPAGITSTLAGLAGSVGSADGIGYDARFNGPLGVALDSANTLYVADSLNDTIRRIVLAPSPQLTDMSLSNGLPRFVLNGPLGSSYVIQASSNLVAWLAISTNAIGAEGSVAVADTGAANKPRRFYRAVPQPSAGPILIPATSGVVTSPFIITNNYVYQPIETTVVTSAGRAVYTFTTSAAGNYVMEAMVNAPNTGANSFFLNIDAEPVSPLMIWDVLPLTTGFALDTVSWRGNGTDTADQYVPKVFTLTAGTHQLIVRGREAFALLQSITISPSP